MAASSYPMPRRRVVAGSSAHVPRFAQLAKCLVDRSGALPSLALGAAVPPLARRHAEAGAERSGEGRRGREAVIEGDFEDGRAWARGEDARGVLDPLPLDVGEERLADEGGEDAVEVEGREGGDAARLGEAQRLAQPRADMVDDAIDALLVLEPGRSRPGIIAAARPLRAPSHVDGACGRR